MPSIQQPQIENRYGVLLTVGMVVNTDRCALVMPMCLSNPTPDLNVMCNDAAVSFEDNAMADFQNCFGAKAEVRYLQAEGMQDGAAPARNDFSSGTYMGSAGSGDTLPASCGILVVWYEDVIDVTPPDRIRVAKNTIPGIPSSEWDGDTLNGTLQTAAETWAELVQNGFASSLYPSYKWYRFLAAPKPRVTLQQVKRVFNIEVRGYVGTQRRRNVPH